MAFTFTVETGAGVTDANSYCSVAAADAYHEARLRTEKWQEATTAERERALAMATKLLDQQMEWRGARVLSREFPAWPRTGMYDKAGILIDAATLPTCLVEATAELARRLLEDDRIGKSEERAVSISSGGRSRSYATGFNAPIVPQSITCTLSHLTVPSRLLRVG